MRKSFSLAFFFFPLHFLGTKHSLKEKLQIIFVPLLQNQSDTSMVMGLDVLIDLEDKKWPSNMEWPSNNGANSWGAMKIKQMECIIEEREVESYTTTMYKSAK